MADWIVCPNCHLHHSVRPTRVCPRCKLSIDGAPAPADAGPSPALPSPPNGLASPFPAEPATAAQPAPVARTPVEAGGCVHHPEVTTGLVSCRRCGQRFCRNCVVALRGAFFCIDCKGEQVRDVQSGAVDRRLSVMECVSMGWALITQDFWAVWLVGLVMMAISLGVGLFGMLPLIGSVIQIGVMFFVTPPLQAGLAYAMLRKIDGGPAEVGNLFEAFRSRYWPSVLVMLPVMGLYLVTIIAVVAGVFVFATMHRSLSTTAQHTATMLGVVLLGVVLLIAILVAAFLTSAVWFAFVEMWDGPTSGWPAFVAGLRVAKDNLGSTLGLAFMLGLAGAGAVLAGILALCVGLLFTMPFITAWITVAHAYAYRSWSRTGSARQY